MSEHEKHKIFSSTDCIPEQTMFDYIDNKLSSKERHTVEKHLLDCELCSDALEGLELVKDRKRIAAINQKVNEYIASKNERKIIVFNYRTITAIAAGLLLLIGSVYFFKMYTSDNMTGEKGVAELKEPMPPPPAEITEAQPNIPDSTQTVNSLDKTKGLSENEISKQPSGYHTEEKTTGYNKVPAAGAGTVSTTPPAGNTIITPGQTSNDDIVVVAEDTDEKKLKTDESKKEEKEVTDKNSYSWTPAPAQNNTEAVEWNGNKKNRSKAKFRSRERSAAYSYEAPKSNTDKDGLSKEEPVALSTINDSVYFIADEMPEYPGGNAEMMKFISKNYSYKSIDKDSVGTNTKIIVQFVIDKNGNIKDAKIVKGINPKYDKEALRVVNIMPRWKPGKQQGQPISVKYNLPIQLELK